jgi:hypothetical protein
LIHIKDSRFDRDEDHWENLEEDRMPADTLLLSLAICAVFALFAGVLMWADLTTSRWMRNRQDDAGRSVAPATKKAA